jgi:hypothetical protein
VAPGVSASAVDHSTSHHRDVPSSHNTQTCTSIFCPLRFHEPLSLSLSISLYLKSSRTGVAHLIQKHPVITPRLEIALLCSRHYCIASAYMERKESRRLYIWSFSIAVPFREHRLHSPFVTRWHCAQVEDAVLIAEDRQSLHDSGGQNLSSDTENLPPSTQIAKGGHKNQRDNRVFSGRGIIVLSTCIRINRGGSQRYLHRSSSLAGFSVVGFPRKES